MWLTPKEEKKIMFFVMKYFHPRGHIATQHTLCSVSHLCTTGSSFCHVVWELSTVTPSTSWVSRMDGTACAVSSFNPEFYSPAMLGKWKGAGCCMVEACLITATDVMG